MCRNKKLLKHNFVTEVSYQLSVVKLDALL